MNDDKYIHLTPSGKYRVCFPTGIKNPRRLGVFETKERARIERDKFLSNVGVDSPEQDDDTEDTGDSEQFTNKVIDDATSQSILCAFDMHCPYQHDDSLSIVRQVSKALHPDCLIFGGDVLDFYKLSRFVQDESRARSVQDELDIWHTCAKDLIDTLPTGAKRYFIPGNHEARLKTYLLVNPQLSSLRVLELDSLLKLPELGIESAGKIAFLSRRLLVIHGRYVSVNQGMAVKREIKQRGWQQSIVQGHGHSTGAFELRGELWRVEGAEVGCLCQDSWYSDDDLAWQRGFAVITVKNGSFVIENIKIDGKTCIFRGDVYHA